MRKYLWLAILPFAIYYMGVALNVLVMTANGGLMPYVSAASWPQANVQPGTITDAIHVTWYPGVHLAFLADWIQVHFIHKVVSPGDLCLLLGTWMQPYCIGGFLALSLIDPAVVRE